VVFEGSKVNQITVQHERGHLIFYGFLRVRSGIFNRYPDFLQDLLNVRGETGDVFIDILGFLISAHISFCSLPKCNDLFEDWDQTGSGDEDYLKDASGLNH
jgi:hypothetical protein